MLAIHATRLGGPEVLEVADIPDPTPGEGEIAVRVAAAGVNFIDTYHRIGLYPMQTPFIPGLEGAGTVVEVGSGVDGFSIGDRVAWTNAIGSYAEVVTMPAGAAVTVPEDVPLDVAAAVMLQGLTAHYLAVDTFPLAEGDRCLVHAGAGGVGLLLIQIAKRRGAEVFATVGTPEKAELARGAGADHVIEYRERDFAQAIVDIAGPRPLDVVYDGVGRTTFDAGLGLLRKRGMMVAFGNASGPVGPVDLLALSRGGSLFLTRPTLFDYIATRADFESRTTDLFGWIAGGELDVHIGLRLPLTDAADAHRALEGRSTTGKVLLMPEEG